MKVLHLTLKKRWFDLVGNGKEEEYREVNSFWQSRLQVNGYHQFEFKTFDRVLFANGGHFGNVPKKTFECNGIEIREGRPEWGAEPGKKYFVIKLGKQIKP